MTAAGFTVYFLQGFRSTPELSFTVRYKKCSCGIMVTASHNPPSDNAVKVYWSTGGQILPPHDKGIIERVMTTQEIRRANFDEMLAAGKIVFCQDEVDAKFQQAVLTQATPGPRKLKVIYSPLHGVGATAVMPVLAADGFNDVEVFGPHAKPDGDFPNVPGHVANPENPQVFDAIIERAKAAGADLALATDPDCDRIGCAAPLRFVAAGGSVARGKPVACGTASGNAHRQPDRRAAGRLRAGEPPRNRPAQPAAFHRANAGHHAADSPHRRQLRRAHDRRPAGRLQVDRRRDRRVRPRAVCLRHRRIARLHGRHATCATRTAPWRRCCCASWRPS